MGWHLDGKVTALPTLNQPPFLQNQIPEVGQAVTFTVGCYIAAMAIASEKAGITFENR